MDNIELENEIELRMNPHDFSLSTGGLIDIMNEYDLSEHDVAFVYSKIVERKREELVDTSKDVIKYFRDKGNHYPSFNEFKTVFKQYGPTFVDDKILRDMHRRETRDSNQISMFEIRKMIREGLGSMWSEFDPEEFEGDAKKAAMQDIGDEFEELGTTKYEKGMDKDEFIGNLDRVKLNLPSDEEEFERISSMMKKKKSHEDLFGAGTLNEEGIGQQGLFKPQDSQGNDINLKALVTNLEGTKKGRVLGFGDDGQGNQTIRVSWAWPMDMKFTAPEEMGDKVEMAADLIVQGMNENNGEAGRNNLRAVEVTYVDGTVIPTSMAAHLSDEDIKAYFEPGKLFNIGSVEDNMQAVQSINIIREDMDNLNENEEVVMATGMLNKALMDFHNAGGSKESAQQQLDSVFVGSDSEWSTHVDAMKSKYPDMYQDGIEEARGLGHGVKNSGDRNVKRSNDNSHAPVTTLPEGRTLDSKIKTLSESAPTKKDLLNFISEQATKLAKDIREGK